MTNSVGRARPRAARIPLLAALFLVTLPQWSTAQGQAPARPFGTLREQAIIQQQWLARRMQTVLPTLMRKHGVDMWVIPMREYAEDPVFTSIVSPTTFAARRRTIYVFHDPCTKVPVALCDAVFGRIALGGTSQGGVYRAMRSTQVAAGPAGARAEQRAELWGDEQWRVLRQLFEEHDPKVIAINTSNDWAFADGLSSGESNSLHRFFNDDKWKGRFRPAEQLAVELIATLPAL